MIPLLRGSLRWGLLAAGVVFAAPGVRAWRIVEAAEPNSPAPRKTGEPAARLQLSRPAAPPLAQVGSSSHEQTSAIQVTPEGGVGSLLAMCLDSEENLAVLIGPARYSTTNPPVRSGQVQIYTPGGKKIRAWNVDFAPQLIGVAPWGELLVAGDGKVACFSREGKPLSRASLPFVDEILKDKDALREQARIRRESQLKSYDQQLASFRRQKAELESQPASTAGGKNRGAGAVDLMIANYERAKKTVENQTVDSLVEQIAGRLRTINSICASGDDVFVACGEVKGYGYSVWRLDRSFKNPRQVLTGVGGCCGQMDVQCAGGKLVVAENTRHRVAVYDRDGKALFSFGKRSRTPAGDGFGGCCNPMNTRPGAGGEIYTAESEGIVKQFNAQGEFQRTIGAVQLTGGCKNVAVAASRDGKSVYFCDLPGSRILALTAKPASSAAAD